MEQRTEILIETYFAGTLTEKEHAELKERLANDVEAAQSFALQQQLARPVSKRKLSGSIQNPAWREATKPPFRKITMPRLILSAAAGIALLIGVIFLFRQYGPVDENALANAFQHYPNKMKFKNLGGEGEVAPPEVLDAFKAYDQQIYPTAAALLTEAYNNAPDRDDYRFYLGVSLSGAGSDHQAINVLAPLAMANQSSYKTPALYYLGLSMMRIQDKAAAKKYLEAYLAAPDGVMFKKQAKALLRTLDK